MRGYWEIAGASHAALALSSTFRQTVARLLAAHISFAGQLAGLLHPSGELRTARTITESQSGVMRRSDSGLGDSSARRTGVDRSHDRRGRHSAALGRGRFEARRAGAAIICGG